MLLDIAPALKRRIILLTLQNFLLPDRAERNHFRPGTEDLAVQDRSAAANAVMNNIFLIKILLSDNTPS